MQVPSKKPSENDEKQESFINALIPYWDLANHRAGGQLSTDYEDDEGESDGFLKCMANRDFDPGQQFTIYYGERGNHDLLIHNGFAVQDNPDDFLQVRLGVGKNDSLAEGKKSLLESLGISPHGHFALKSSKIEPLLLAFLRVICLKTKDEIEEWSSDDDKSKDLLHAGRSADLDKRAHQYLMTRCELLLKSYPTTLEGDEEERKNNSEKTSAVQKFCLHLVMGEKRILMDNIKLCKEQL